MWVALQEFHEGAIAALLRHRPTGRLLLAASAHLHWDPAHPHLKLLQAALLAHSLARIASSASAASREGEGEGEGAAQARTGASTGSGTGSAVGGSGDAEAEASGPGPGATHGSDVLLVLGGDFNSLARKYLPDRFDPQVS